MSFAQILAIASGGAAGALARSYALRLLPNHLFAGFPYALIIINALGCFTIGLLAVALLNRLDNESLVRGAVIIGFLGSFTTFSSFALDAGRLFSQQSAAFSLLYIGLTMTATLGSFALGAFAARLFG